MFRLYLEFARVMSPDRDNGKMASLVGGVHTGINLTICCNAGLCTAIERMGSGWVLRDVASTVLISCDLSFGRMAIFIRFWNASVRVSSDCYLLTRREELESVSIQVHLLHTSDIQQFTAGETCYALAFAGVLAS